MKTQSMPISSGRTSLRRHMAGCTALASLLAANALLPATAHAQMLQGSSSGYNNDQNSSDQNSKNNNNNNNNSDSQKTNSSSNDAATNYHYQAVEVSGSDKTSTTTNQTAQTTSDANPRLKKPAAPNEFEQFVQFNIGRKLPRFGAQLLLPDNRDYSVPATASVPPDYVLNVGDVVSISMAGSIEGSVDKEIRTDGKIFLPRVGPIKLAGVRYGSLKDVISAAIGTQYRGYTVNVSVASLRGVHVYVTGYANNPGTYTVSSLSTMANAVLAAGGPSSGGSYRSIKLIRNNEVVGDFDLYQLVLKGHKKNDIVLQDQDVLYIAPVGPEVAIEGSVNSEAIFEMKDGETAADLLGYAGGMNSLADKSRLMLYRLSDNDVAGVRPIPIGDAASFQIQRGDIINVLSEGTLLRPVDKQSVLVRIEGEVTHPGTYYVPANTPLSDVVGQAGGLTSRAYVFGTRMERVSVKQQQTVSYREAIQQLEVALAAAPLSRSQLGASGDQTAEVAAAQSVLDKLRRTEPDGRLVLDVAPNGTELPGQLTMENNDRIVVPPRPTSVGVYGAVYHPTAFMITGGQSYSVQQYLSRAGGPIKAADRNEIFVVRANGAVVSKREGALKARALPGDLIFVPVKTQAGGFWSKLKDLTSVMFQVGLSTAAFVAVTK